MAAADVATARSTPPERDVLADVLVTAERLPTPTLARPAAIATGLDLALLRAPASIDVVDLEDRTQRGARTLAEATRGTTGLTFTTRAGAPGVFQSRGFTENALVTLYDGLRVQSATVTARAYDTFNFERIEVLRGPASLTHGEGATAGAVNYVRRKPRLGEARAELLAEGGSFERLRLGAAVSGGLTDAVGGLLSASVQRWNGFAAGSEHESLHAVAGLGGRLGERGGWLVEADWLDTAVDDAYWGQPLVAGRVDARLRDLNYNVAPDNAMEDRVGWLRVLGTAALADGVTWRGQVYGYDADRDWRNYYAFAWLAGPPEQVEVRNVENLGYDHRLRGTRQELRIDWAAGGRAAQTVVAADWSDTDFSSPRRDGAPLGGVALRPRFALLAPAPVAFAPLTGTRLRQREADVRQAGIGFEQSLALGAHVTLLGGVRGTWIDATLARPEASPPVPAFDVSLDAVDWRAALTYAPVADHTLYLAGSTGSEPVESLLLLPLAQANLRLAKATGAEAGWKGRWLGGALEGQAAAYWLEKDRLPSTNPANPNLAPQVGRQTSRGLEAGANYAGEALRVGANVAYVDAEFREFSDFGAFRDRVRPANVPEWVVNAHAAWDPLPRVTLGAFAQYVGARPGNNANATFLDRYATLDAFLEWRAAPRLTLTGRIVNAFDETYVEWATQTFGQNNVYFGSPRRYEVAVTVRL